MGRLIKLFFLLVNFVAGFQSIAQRNLIDVPSSEIVESEKLFYQLQGYYSKHEWNTAATATVGIGKNFEVGAAVYRLIFRKGGEVEIDPDHPEDNLDFLITMQKGFDLSERVSLGIGTRSGINAAKHNDDIHFVNFNFINARFSLGENDHTLVGGAYYGNNQYTGPGTNWGIIAGGELKLVKDKVSFVADFISGNSAISVINAGLEVSLPRAWKLTLGMQLPMPGSESSEGALIQISRN